MARQRSKSPVRASTTGTGSRTPRAAAVDSTSDATASPYRTPGWTVAKLKEELRQRQLSTAGSKLELVERLEESSGVDEEVAVETAGAYASWTMHQLQAELRIRRAPTSGSKAVLVERLLEEVREERQSQSPARTVAGERQRRTTALSSSSVRADVELLNYEESTKHTASALEKEVEELTLLKQPVKTVRFFLWMLADYAHDVTRFLASHRLTIVAVIVIALSFGYFHEFGSTGQQELSRSIATAVLWYGYWMALGVASSIGLGTGLHTFLLFLGPFIARVTLFAYECESLDFAVHGKDAFTCRGRAVSALSPLAILSKVSIEAFAWGAGTAIGELPPYFVARAAALAGKSDDEFDHIEAIKQKPATRLTLWERVQLIMFHLMQRLGFFGILLAASIPNPLFDLAGITCGHFLVPFHVFFGATFIGKAFFKAGIQALAIIALFSKGTIEMSMSLLVKRAPALHSWATEFLTKQKHKFSGKHDHGHQTDSDSIVGQVWNLLIAAMIFYFLLSIVQSLAAHKLKKEADVNATKKRNEARVQLRTRLTKRH